MEQMKLVAQVPREEEWEKRVTTGLPEAWPVPMAAAWETWWRDSEAVTETLLSGSASDLGTMKSFNRTGWGGMFLERATYIHIPLHSGHRSPKVRPKHHMLVDQMPGPLAIVASAEP